MHRVSGNICFLCEYRRELPRRRCSERQSARTDVDGNKRLTSYWSSNGVMQPWMINVRASCDGDLIGSTAYVGRIIIMLCMVKSSGGGAWV